jgi:hypothetical protein
MNENLNWSSGALSLSGSLQTTAPERAMPVIRLARFTGRPNQSPPRVIA